MNRHTRNSRFATSMMAVALMGCMIEAAGAAQVGAPRQPVEYRVKEKSLIGNELHEAGAVVLYAGLPAENLEPLCDEGRARAAEYVQSNQARVTKLVADHSESGVGDPAKFMEAFTRAMAEERAEHQVQLAAQQETMAKMLELQQESALQLAQAAQNMATLAAALTAQAAPAASETPAAPTDEKPTDKAAGKAKG